MSKQQTVRRKNNKMPSTLGFYSFWTNYVRRKTLFDSFYIKIFLGLPYLIIKLIRFCDIRTTSKILTYVHYYCLLWHYSFYIRFFLLHSVVQNWIFLCYTKCLLLWPFLCSMHIISTFSPHWIQFQLDVGVTMSVKSSFSWKTK